MKGISKILLSAGLAISLSNFGQGQATAFRVIRIPNSIGNTPTAISNAADVVVNVGSPGAFNVTVWNRLNGSQNLALQGSDNVGSGINAAKDVVGVGDPNGNGQPRGFLAESNGTTTWLGTLGGSFSAAEAVNSNRAVVGMSYTAAGVPHAFLWTSANGMNDLTPSLTNLGGSTAMGINSVGEAVGYYYPDGGSNVLGFTWTQAGGLSSFGNPGTLAFAVNDSGTVAGQMLTASGYRHAFSWTPTGGIVDLGTLGGTQSSAMAINNKGWVVGTSLPSGGTGVLHGFLWTPSGGMQDFTTLAGFAPGLQPYSLSVNDFGNIAISISKRVLLLIPNMTATATSSANPSHLGQPVTFTATVTSIAGPPPDGELLTFTINGQQVSAPMKDGVAQVTINGMTKGSHVLAVSYAGDANYLLFRYTLLTQVVNP